MQIKITCSKEEFAALIRRCALSENCPDCALYDCCGSLDGEGDRIDKIAEFELTTGHTE